MTEIFSHLTTLELCGIIALCILALAIIIGIFRIIFTPADSAEDMFMQLFCLDLLIDLLQLVFMFIGAILNNDDTDW